MSMLTPQPYQKFTHTLVLDKKFRLKYGLTYAQTEIINKTIFKIHNIEPVIGGVKVKVKLENRNEQILGVNSEFGSEVIDLKRFENWVGSVTPNK